MSEPYIAASRWARLREAQDEFEDAYAERPARCGSEEMMRDELAGDSLALMLAVVEAAAVYRSAARAKETPYQLRQRARDLDEALHALDPENCPKGAS